MRKPDDADAGGWAGRGPVCRHLGTEDDRSTHFAEPSAQHRCYLWWQRDRIDLAHQAAFCLTEAHSECPWLSVTPPTGVARGGRILPLRPEAQTIPTPPSGRALEILTAIWAWLRMMVAILVRRGAALLAVLGTWTAAAAVAAWRWLRPAAVAAWRWLRPAAARLARFAWAQLRRAPGMLLRLVRLVHLVDRRAGASPPPPDPMANPAAVQGAPPYGVVPAGEPLPADVKRTDEAVAATAVQLPSVSAPVPDLPSMPAPAPQPPSDPVPAAQVGASNLTGYLSTGRRLVKPPVVTWRCNACEAINAGPSLVCTKCGRPSPEVEEQLTASGDELLTKGLAGLKAKNEDLAHAYFVLASEATPENELAWYWRAKTAPSIDEVIRCLECIVALNPGNTKARAELESARQRRRPEQPQLAEAAAAPAKPVKPAQPPKIVGELRWWALQAAGLCTFALSIALLVPYALGLTDLRANPDVRGYLDLIPSVELPKLLVHLPNLPAFDVGPALPFVLGLLLMHAAFVIVSGGGLRARVWTALLGVGTAALVLSFGTAATGSGLAVDIAAVAIAAVLVGDAQAGNVHHAEASGRTTL